MHCEHDIQVAFFQWVDFQNQYPDLKSAFAIPNGGKRNISVAKKLKAEGVRSGIPDIFIPVAKQGYNGLFIEVKTQKGATSKQQKQWLNTLSSQGYKAVICRGLDNILDEVKKYFNAS